MGWDDIVKGYEYEKERYVVLTEEDFKRANVEATQTVDIVAFVDAEEVAPTYFETPYYLSPDKRGEKGYALLRETLKETNKIGIATVVIRTRQYLAALIPSGDVIVLNTLRYKNELKSAKDLEVPSGNLKASGVSPREIEMAKKLVEEMTEQWKPERYRDTYHDDLMKLINKRIKEGKTEVITEAEEERRETCQGRSHRSDGAVEAKCTGKGTVRHRSVHRYHRNGIRAERVPESYVMASSVVASSRRPEKPTDPLAAPSPMGEAHMGLQQYWNKRNFNETPEPRGASQSSSARRQFAIQKHAASRLHYDFRLELDGTLKSWAVPKGPSLDPKQKRLAVHVEDHPLEYGGFEGIIPPKQYGAGTVLLWDRGSWSPVGDPLVGYRRGRLKFNLNGQKLRGLWNLVRMGARHEEGKENWLLIKEKDDEARSGRKSDVTENLTESVASGRTIEQIASGRHRVWQSNRPARKQATSLPSFISPPQIRERNNWQGPAVRLRRNGSLRNWRPWRTRLQLVMSGCMSSNMTAIGSCAV